MTIFFDQLLIRERPLRVLVQHLHVTMCGSVVEVEPVFFYVLTVVTFVAGKAEHPLFEDGVAAIPQGQCENQQLVAVTNPCNAVFAPTISFTACHIVGEEFPGTTVRAVIFAYAAPGTFTDIGTPLA